MKQELILYKVTLIDPRSNRDDPRIAIENIERVDRSIPLHKDLEDSALVFLFATCKNWKQELEGINLERLELEDWEMYSQMIDCGDRECLFTPLLPLLVQS